MNRLKMTLAVLLLACAQAARSQQVLTVETKWNEKTVQLSTTGVLSATFDIGGFGAAGYAIAGGTQTLNGADGTVQGSTVAIASGPNMAQNVVLFDYWFNVAGSTGNYKIAQTIKTPSQFAKSTSGFNNSYPDSNFFSAPSISTSSVVIVPTGTTIFPVQRARVVNPIFYLNGLMKSATYTLTVDYGVPTLQ